MSSLRPIPLDPYRLTPLPLRLAHLAHCRLHTVRIGNGFGVTRHQVSAGELLSLKAKYKLSIQAWVYRAQDLGIITPAAAGAWFKNLRTANQHRQEPGDTIPPETPQRLTRLVLRAVAEDVISRTRAAELLRISWPDLMEQYALHPQEQQVALGN